MTAPAALPKVEESISQAPAKSAWPSKPKPSASTKAPLPKGYAYGRAKTDGLPAAPTRSPSPPTLVIAGPRGNRFTDQDKDYFLRYILWALQCDPSLTRQELCNNLEVKVGLHHASFLCVAALTSCCRLRITLLSPGDRTGVIMATSQIKLSSVRAARSPLTQSRLPRPTKKTLGHQRKLLRLLGSA